MPSKFTSIERCLLNSEGKHARDTFAPIVGSSFDSCQEAYEQYNLFAWENVLVFDTASLDGEMDDTS